MATLASLPTNIWRLQIDIQYRWTDLTYKNGNQYLFPEVRRTVDRKTLEVPGVYRWIKTERHNKRIVCLYIGESGNLYHRFYGYLNQNESQATSFRIGKTLRALADEGAIIRYQKLELSALRFAGKKISWNDFRSMHVRQAIEQALIVYHKKHGECELNKEKSNYGTVHNGTKM